MDIIELLHHMHMGGHCICVYELVLQQQHVFWTVLQDLREVVRSITRNGSIGQRLQETLHWQEVCGSELLLETADDRGTHISGSLGRQHIRHQTKFTAKSSEFQYTQDV